MILVWFGSVSLFSLSIVSDGSPESEVENRVPTADPRPDRDSSRRSLLRANSAVAVVMTLVLLLAWAAVWLSLRTTALQAVALEQQHRAEAAETRARTDLSYALLAESKTIRAGQTVIRRPVALENIRRAAEIRPTAELRHEAIAVLALPDYHLESTIPLDASVRTYAFDRQVRWCALGLTNGDVVIYRTGQEQEYRRLRLRDGPIPEVQKMPVLLEFSPDGAALAVRYNRGAFAVWEVETEKVRFLRDADEARRPASRPRFSPDGRILVAPVFVPDGFAVLDALTGRTIAHFSEASSFHHAAVRPGTNQFAVFDGSRVLILDWVTRRHVAELAFPSGARFLEWDPSGRRLAVVGNRLDAMVWHVDENRVQQLTGHQNHINSAVFDPTGEYLSTTALDGTSRIWNLRDGRMIGMASDRRLIQWGTEGRSGWVVPKQRLEVRRLVSSGAYAASIGIPEQADGSTMDISQDGEWAASITDATDRPDASGLLIWDLERPHAPQLLRMTNVQSVCFQPGADRLFLVSNRNLYLHEYVVVTNGTERGLQLGPPNYQRATPYRWEDLLTISADGGTRAYVELPTGEVFAEHLRRTNGVVQIRELAHNKFAIRSGSVRGAGTIALNPDGRWLACGVDGFHGSFVYDTLTGLPRMKLSDNTGGVQFSPDGRWLVLAAATECRLFRTSDWTNLWTRPGDSVNPSFSGAAAFSPDGSRLAWVPTAQTVTLADTLTGDSLAVLESPQASPLNTLRWSADGRRVVAATRANTLDIWQPGALRRDLAPLGLDWEMPAPVAMAIPPASGVNSVDLTRWLAVALFVGGGVVAVVVLLSLHRHRRLIEDYSRTEALAQRWERELQVEREVGQLKSGFVSMVSHEFRTPLGIIASSAQLLEHYLDRLQPDERREQTQLINNNVQRMAHLIDEVLVFGQIEAGRLQFKPVPLDLGKFAKRMTEEMLAATGRTCPIELKLGELPEALADENLLRHVISNLLSNAVKYSREGRTVKWEIQAVGRTAIFTVRDQGRGIPMADQARLFRSFQRGTNVSDIRGTGIGLKIVKQCVDLHNGHVIFESREGQGTLFTVRLPLFSL